MAHFAIKQTKGYLLGKIRAQESNTGKSTFAIDLAFVTIIASYFLLGDQLQWKIITRQRLPGIF